MASSPSEHKSNTLPLTPAVLWVYAGIALVAVGIVYYTWMNFLPLIQAGQVHGDRAAEKVPLPEYQLAAWHPLPVQSGARLKPFETAARETLLRIHGRNRFQGRDGVAVVLDWMLEYDPETKPIPKSKWDSVPFILCEFQALRLLIYQLRDDGSLDTSRGLEYDEVHGKFMSPAQLREFRTRLHTLERTRQERFKELLSDQKVKDAKDEALGRLGVYESVRPLPIDSEVERLHDPFAFVALDKVKGAPWFSLAELRQLNTLGDIAWKHHMKERVKTVPQMYLSKTHKAALEHFQSEVRAGNGANAVAALEPALAKNRAALANEFKNLWAKGQEKEADEIFDNVYRVLPKVKVDNQEVHAPAVRTAVENIKTLAEQEKKTGKSKAEELGREVASLLQYRDTQRLEELKSRLPARAGYDTDDPAYRMLHLTFLELQFPDIWEDAANWQPLPTADVVRVVLAYRALIAAYRSDNAEAFDSASAKFMTVVEEVSEKAGPYPGEDGIGERLGALLTGGTLHPPSRQLLDMERTYNRISPFTWSWVLMLASLLVLCVALGLQSRALYRVGLGFYLVSLAFQIFGFFVRITISGRPPVSNIYETVIWVAFMSGVFALVLELMFHRMVIAVAGALVATIGLVLADQMPLALDPKINPLVPVLRSNFWLTIHVLTIVSSYAGGTLAWGLGNIALFMLLFGSDNRQATIKLLSQFVYRAMQIAVLLLAAGTFLGGWWAAYSWGRFWGWDPKETGALIALLCYVIPLHMRYVGWIKDFGLAVAAILCYAAILMSWYGVNFLFPAGLHAYATGSSGGGWVYWACLINIEWVLVGTLIYWRKQSLPRQTLSELPTVTAGSSSEHIKA